MQTLVSDRPVDRWLKLAGGFAMLTGIAVWIGQLGHLPWLATWLPGELPMMLNTAFCVALCGGALLGLAWRSRAVVFACSAVVVGFGVSTQVVYFLGWAFGFDERLLEGHWLIAVPELARGPSNTVLAISLLGVALGTAVYGRRTHGFVLAVSGVVAAFALLPLVHLIGSLWAAAPYESMSAPTILSLLVLSGALLAWGYTSQRAEVVGPLPLFAAAFGMLISIGVMTSQSNADFLEANRAVTRSQQIRVHVTYLVSEVARLESSARGYALTGMDSFRMRDEFHRGEVRRMLRRLDVLTSGNAAQRARVAEMLTLAQEKFDQVAALQEIRAKGDVAAAADYLRRLQSDRTSRLVQLADDVHSEENRLLAEHERTEQRLERGLHTVQVAGGLLALGLLGAATIMARKATAERRAAEVHLRDSEQRFRQLAGAAFEGIVISENGRVIDVNEQMLAMLGYTRSEMLGREIIAMIAPESRAAVAAAMESEREAVYENRVLRKDGTVLEVETQARRLELDGRRIRLTAVRDITERKRAEQALRESETRFRTLADATAEAVVISADGRVIDVNDHALEMFAFTREEAIGTRVLDYVAPDALHRVTEILKSGVDHYEARFRRKDGREFDCEVRVRFVRQGGRQVRLAAMRDVTARNQFQRDLQLARDEALAASRLKSEFLATMSHEIRTPMNGIIGMGELLAQVPLDAEAREMVSVIQSSAQSLLGIVNEILDFSKIEAGKLRIEPQEFALHAVVNETFALFEPRARQKGLAFRLDLAAAPDGLFLGDGGRIRQVLGNLVSNAVKFTERGAVTVRVAAVSDDEQRVGLRVSVEDTGIGIPVAAHPRLFQPFTQVDGSVTRRFGGTGLGLAISRQLVTLMGGEIGFTSEAGRGSTFWFELSLARPAAAPGEPRVARALPAPPCVRGVRVLVVDDNEANRIVARRLLEKIGCAVSVVENGTTALAVLGRERFDAVFMDCQMPDLDGYEVTRRIRAGAVPGANPRVPVIALTAHAMASDRDLGLAAGMNDYVSKPVAAAELHAALVRCGFGLPPIAVATAGAAASDLSVLDPRAVAATRALPGRDGPSLWPELVALFVREEPRWLDEIAQAGAARAGDRAAATAHTLAGSCASLGAAQMRLAALAVERAARAGDWLEFMARLADLHVASASLRAELASVGVASS